MAAQQAPKMAPNPNEVLLKPKSKVRPALLVLLIVLIAVAASVGGTWFVFTQKEAAVVAEAVKASELNKPTPAVYVPLMPAFVVNYQHGGRQRYLQVSLTLMGRDVTAMQDLEVHVPVLRNELVLLLSAQQFDALGTPEGKEALRRQIIEQVQQIARKEVGSPAVEQVLFTNFVLQ